MSEFMGNTPYERLKPFDEETGLLNVIVETPKGNRNKFEYDPRLDLFFMSYVLPVGSAFPYDFGYLPSTLAEDDDPVDVLILMDSPAFTGCLVYAKLIGVIKIQQTEDGKTGRNDRLVAVAERTKAYKDVDSFEDMHPNMIDEIEHFFASYNRMLDRKFKMLGRSGKEEGMEIIKKGVRRHQEQFEGGEKEGG